MLGIGVCGWVGDVDSVWRVAPRNDICDGFDLFLQCLLDRAGTGVRSGPMFFPVEDGGPLRNIRHTSTTIVNIRRLVGCYGDVGVILVSRSKDSWVRKGTEHRDDINDLVYKMIPVPQNFNLADTTIYCRKKVAAWTRFVVG